MLPEPATRALVLLPEPVALPTAGALLFLWTEPGDPPTAGPGLLAGPVRLPAAPPTAGCCGTLNGGIPGGLNSGGRPEEDAADDELGLLAGPALRLPEPVAPPTAGATFLRAELVGPPTAGPLLLRTEPVRPPTAGLWLLAEPVCRLPTAAVAAASRLPLAERPLLFFSLLFFSSLCFSRFRFRDSMASKFDNLSASEPKRLRS